MNRKIISLTLIISFLCALTACTESGAINSANLEGESTTITEAPTIPSTVPSLLAESPPATEIPLEKVTELHVLPPNEPQAPQIPQEEQPQEPAQSLPQLCRPGMGDEMIMIWGYMNQAQRVEELIQDLLKYSWIHEVSIFQNLSDFENGIQILEGEIQNKTAYRILYHGTGSEGFVRYDFCTQ